MKTDADIDRVVQIFKSGNLADQRAYIESCPPSQFKNAALSAINPYSRMDRILMGLNMLASTYCEGIDCELGIKLSKASYLLSQEAFKANPSVGHLTNAGQSVSNCVVGFSLLGEHEELIKVAGEAIAWLENASKQIKTGVPLTDAIKNADELINNNIFKLRQYQIEAYIQLAQYRQAKKLLQQAKQLLRANQTTELYFLKQLEQRIDELIIDPIILPSEKGDKNDTDVMIEFSQQMIDGVSSIMKDISSEDSESLREIASIWFEAEPNLKKEVYEKMPDSLEEWVARTASIMGIGDDLRTGKAVNRTQGSEDFLNLAFQMLNKKYEILFEDIKNAVALPHELKQRWYQILNGIDLSIKIAVEEIEALKEEIDAASKAPYKYFGIENFDKLDAFNTELRLLKSQLTSLSSLCHNYHE
jgi:hypothetical protein